MEVQLLLEGRAERGTVHGLEGGQERGVDVEQGLNAVGGGDAAVCVAEGIVARCVKC